MVERRNAEEGQDRNLCGESFSDFGRDAAAATTIPQQ